MLIPLSVNMPTLPARSVACPLALLFAPSVDSVTGPLSDPGATPDSASTAEKLTTTAVLFQLFEFGDGDAAPLTTGGVLSMFSVTLVVAVFPALSTAVPETV